MKQITENRDRIIAIQEKARKSLKPPKYLTQKKKDRIEKLRAMKTETTNLYKQFKAAAAKGVAESQDLANLSAAFIYIIMNAIKELKAGKKSMKSIQKTMYEEPATKRFMIEFDKLHGNEKGNLLIERNGRYTIIEGLSNGKEN